MHDRIQELLRRARAEAADAASTADDASNAASNASSYCQDVAALLQAPFVPYDDWRERQDRLARLRQALSCAQELFTEYDAPGRRDCYQYDQIQCIITTLEKELL